MLPQYVSVRKLFAVALVAKVGCSVLGWLLNDPWILGAALPLLIMAAYCTVGYHRRNKYELSDEKFADSCYYLGFIFTITSIIVSLIDLPSIGDRLGDIAIRFGVAMVSTVAGLGFRVYLVSFRRDLKDVTTTIEDSLASAAERFQVQLDLAVEKLRGFVQTVDDASDQTVARVSVALEEVSASHSKEFTTLIAQLTVDNEKAAQRVTKSIVESTDQFHQAVGSYTKYIQSATEEAVRQIKSVAEELYQYQENYAERVQQGSDAYAEVISSFNSRLQSALQSVDLPPNILARQLDTPLEALSAQIVAITKKIEETANGMAAGGNELSSAIGGMTTTVSELREVADSVKGALEEQRRVVNTANAQEEAFLKLARNVKHLEFSLTESAKALSQQQELIADLTRQSAGAAESQQQIVQLVASHGQSNDRLSAAINEVATKFVQAVDQLSDRLADVRQPEAYPQIELVKETEYRGQDHALIAERPADAVPETGTT